MGPLVPEFADHGRRGRDARTLDDLVRIEDQGLGMAPFLEGNVPFAERLQILLLDLSVIGKENVKSFCLGEHRGSDAAFRSAQYYDPGHAI